MVAELPHRVPARPADPTVDDLAAFTTEVGRVERRLFRVVVPVPLAAPQALAGDATDLDRADLEGLGRPLLTDKPEVMSKPAGDQSARPEPHAEIAGAIVLAGHEFHERKSNCGV